MSPSTRGRGSKRGDGGRYRGAGGRPLREGADRNIQGGSVLPSSIVALYARARIETGYPWWSAPSFGSRPLREGADRNSVYTVKTQSGEGSPSTRGRGSKPRRRCSRRRSARVALYARARIETGTAGRHPPAQGRSPSTRGRGSKHVPVECVDVDRGSPSTRGRGSKHPSLVTIYALYGRPLREGADRNPLGDLHGLRVWVSPSTRGRGSKPVTISTFPVACVALYARARIETACRAPAR